MIEAVGHEYMEEFFGCCESLLAEDGIFVLQVITEKMQKLGVFNLKNKWHQMIKFYLTK